MLNYPYRSLNILLMVISVLGITGVAQASSTIWPAATVPGVADSGPDSAVELGVKFRADSSGYITGIRFYKSVANTGSHVGNLWTSNGTLLATATFANETGSGWQQVNFSTPVAVAANTVYVASYHTNSGHYSDDQNYFLGKGIDSPPLHALADGVSGFNGVYAYGSSSKFPNLGWNSSNYWVDVVFNAASSDTTAPTVTAFAIPTTATTLTIPITTFTATDNSRVTGYLVSESATAPAPTAMGWTGTAPVSYSFSSAGSKTLYGWAKDAAGNVSASRSASVTIRTSPPVTATFQTGDGKGSFSQADDGCLSSTSGAEHSSSLKVGKIDKTVYRSAIKFANFIGNNPNQIPIGARIYTANLKLKLGASSYYNTPIPLSIGLHQINEAWEVSNTAGYYGSPGWYYRLGTSRTLWSNIGAGPDISSVANPITSLSVTPTYNQIISFDVTKEVRHWVSQVFVNNGFLISAEDEVTPNTGKVFASSLSAAISDRPVLEVVYDLPDLNDTAPPVINSSTATAIAPHTKQTILSVTTNENAACKFSTIPNIAYQLMPNVFENTYSTTHTQTILGLKDGSTYSYYIRCMDNNGNADTSDYKLSFSVLPDTIAPGRITLTASNCKQNSCDLSWTATGDDGSTGTASTYDIRYSTSNISPTNWVSATQVTGEPSPQVAGMSQTMHITGLDANTGYYFAIKARDAAFNWSDISNVAAGTTSISSTTNSDINAWVTSSSRKIRPFDSQDATMTTSATIEGAKSETQSIQVVITAAGQTLNNVDVSVNLPGFPTTIYKEEFMHVVTPSHMLGDTGEWPDILIPKVDAYYGETRNAFPAVVGTISRAYPFIKALPSKSYGPWRDGNWYSNVVPPSGYVYPYNGTQTGSGNSDVNNQGTGRVSTSGKYLGDRNARYIIVIESSGPIGIATFKWSSDGGVNFQTGVPTATTPVSLGNGVRLTFSGSGWNNDFIAGDEWIFYAGPYRNQPIWIDVNIPKNAVAGNYSGIMTITADNKSAATIPISLTVWNFEIPETSSLKNFFGSASNFTTGHDLPYTDPIQKVYVAAGLRHRISLGDSLSGDSGGGNTISCWSYNESTSQLTMNYDGFDKAMGPYLNGTGSTYVPIGITFPGKLTTFTEPAIVKAGCSISDTTKFINLARVDFIDHLKSKGWFGQFYVYLSDEPSSKASWEFIKTKGSQWRNIAPDVPLWVTTTLRDAIANNADQFIDIYVPISTSEVPESITEMANSRYPRSNYNLFINLLNVPIHDVWWYDACTGAGGCGFVGGRYYTGWSNYGMDSTGLQTRMRPWLTKYFDYHGELYYSVNYNWDHYQGYNHIDPWDTNYYFGVNGDGQLFYPGRPDKIGGATHIPIESLRLKLIRQGLQDYEYMHILDTLGEQPFIQSQLTTLITDAKTFTNDPEVLKAVRESLALRILLHTGIK